MTRANVIVAKTHHANRMSLSLMSVLPTPKAPISMRNETLQLLERADMSLLFKTAVLQPSET